MDEVTKTVTLVDIVTTEDVEVSSQSYVTVGGEGEGDHCIFLRSF